MSGESEYEEIFGIVKPSGDVFHVFVVGLNGPQMTVLTVGVEHSLAAAQTWAIAAVAAQPWIEGNHCPPDAFDRAVSVRKH